MIELELQCANNHSQPILGVVFDNKFEKNQKLLCHECMKTFTQDNRIMGFNVVNQMIGESQKQKREFVETLIDNNQQILKSIQFSLVGLRSSIIQELDSLDKITTSWIQNLEKMKLEKVELVSLKNQKRQQVMERKSSWSVKFNNQLKKFYLFEDCFKLQVMLKDLLIQEQDQPISSQEYSLEIIDFQYKLITFIFHQYILNTKNKVEYINYIKDVIINQNSQKIQNNEFENIFSLFKKEFSQTEQFIFLENKQQNLEYLKIFHQQFLKKLQNSKVQFLDMKQLYSYEIKYDVVAKADIQKYLNDQFIDDFRVNNSENFMSILDMLNIEYDEKLKNKLSPSVFACFSQKQFISSLKYTVNNQEFDFSGTTFGETFKNTYKGLKVIQRIDQQWDNNLLFKKELQQQYIIIRTQIEIKSRYNQSFNYIISPQNYKSIGLRKDYPHQFNTIMIDQNGWKKLYQELYDLITREIGNSKQKREYLSYQSNKNSQFSNNFIIIDIFQKVKDNIKVYNQYFAQFGVILSDDGEKCIYYYSMLIIWIYFCRMPEFKQYTITALLQLLN